jgi:hypothetical protein
MCAIFPTNHKLLELIILTHLIISVLLFAEDYSTYYDNSRYVTSHASRYFVLLRYKFSVKHRTPKILAMCISPFIMKY